MKLSKNEILRLPSDGEDFHETLSFASEDIPEYMGIRRIPEVDVSGKLSFDPYSEHLMVSVTLNGQMILPCSVTMVDVPVRFKSTSNLVYGFKADENDDILRIENESIDMTPDFLGLIWMEVPPVVIRPDLKELPHGEGWEVISETEFNRRKQKTSDPRLAKILDYKPQDE